MAGRGAILDTRTNSAERNAITTAVDDPKTDLRIESTREGIPILDVGPYLAGSPGTFRKLAMELRFALENIGFFYLTNHAVSQDLIDRVFDEAKRFHSQPLDEKMKVYLNRSNNGYMPLKGHAQRHSSLNKDPKPNENKSYFARRERDPNDPDVKAGKDLRDPNQWPGGLPGFKETVLEYMVTMEAFGQRMLPAYALALDMDADYFAPFFEGGETTVRLIHYPPAAAGDGVANVFGTAPHTDRNFATFLAQAKVPGLQIMTTAGEWIPAPAIPGTYIVNSGDTLRRWTNDRFLSTAHRVFNASETDRYSIPFFYAPNLNATIDTVASCVGPDQPVKYPPVTYEQFSLEFLNKNYFHRQKYAGSAGQGAH